MLQAAWLFVGTIAFLWTVLTVLIALYTDTEDKAGDEIVIVTGVVGFILWGVWTFGTLDILVVEGGNTTSFAHPELTILGIVMALLPGYLALTGPIGLITKARDKRIDIDEV